MERNSALPENETIIIANPVSGAGGGAKLASQAAERLRAAGTTVRVTLTQGPGDAVTIARSVPDDASAVVAVGGDGTLREVLTGLDGRPVPVALLGSGTENVVAKALRMPRNVDELCEVLANGWQVRVDLGEANNHLFVILASAGFDAEVVARLVSVRQGPISHLTYFEPLLGALKSYDFPAVRVEIDGQTVFHDRGMVYVGNLPRFAMGLSILHKASPDDGLLDVCCLPCRSGIEVVRIAREIFDGAHANATGAVYTQCESVQISSDSPMPFQCDGDAGGSLPLTCRVRPGAATLIVPPDVSFP